MHILSVSLEKSKSIDYERSCPFNSIKTCMASFTSLKLDEQKQANCCSTENYDDCPIFLARVLRGGKICNRDLTQL
jgi:hypothetical protein